jgi:hypothetical protein
VLTFTQMELRMKDICEGRKNKLEVVQESLDQYRDVYLRVQQKLPVLHAVSLSMGEMMVSFTDFSSGCSKIRFWRKRVKRTYISH